MKGRFVIGIMVTCLLLEGGAGITAPLVAGGTPGGAPAEARLEGQWSLNMKKSKDLPPSFASVARQTLTVARSGDSLVVTNELTAKDGQAVTFPPTIYRLDGTEVYREDSLRASKRWMRAQWTTNGQKLIVTSRVEQAQVVPAVRYTQTDVWQLTNPNRLLIIMTQKFTGVDSTRTERRVYTRLR